MKKFMFSAIAMMAFSVGSIGNTIELTSDNLEVQVNSNTFELDEENLSVIPFLSRCEIVFFGTMAIAQEQGFTPKQAHAIAYAAFAACDEIEQN
jgi:hypothetical protein